MFSYLLSVYLSVFGKREDIICFKGIMYMIVLLFFLQYLSRVVSNLTAENMANISKGLEYAFDQFEKVRRPSTQFAKIQMFYEPTIAVFSTP